MTTLGILHLALAIAALTLGALQFARPKTTAPHRLRGKGFVAAMMVSNVAVFWIYEDTAQLGIFHILAIVSILSLSIATLLIRLPGAGPGRRIAHGHTMLWSYGGLVAAGLGQGASALGFSPWPMIAATFATVAILAFRLDFAAMLRPG